MPNTSSHLARLPRTTPQPRERIRRIALLQFTQRMERIGLLLSRREPKSHRESLHTPPLLVYRHNQHRKCMIYSPPFSSNSNTPSLRCHPRREWKVKLDRDVSCPLQLPAPQCISLTTATIPHRLPRILLQPGIAQTPRLQV